MRDYILPIPELKKIEPILTEYFGYKRAMFENELLATYYHEYPNGISEDICKNYMTDHSFLNTIAVDNGVFDYKRYAPKSTSTSKAFNPVASLWIQNTIYLSLCQVIICWKG